MQDENKENFNVGEDYENPPAMPVSKGQKITAAILAVFAFIVIIFWAVDFKKSISNTAYIDNTNELSGEASSTANEMISDEALKTKDTDYDKINDWDELNIYHTSPYLDDSDSDGLLDGAEIAAGKDPNCPEGRTCNAVEKKADQAESNPQNNQTVLNSGSSTANIANNNLSTSSASKVASSSLPTLQVGNVDQKMVENLLSGTLDATGLRKFLLQSGMEKAMLDKISDDDLMKSYGDVLKPTK